MSRYMANPGRILGGVPGRPPAMSWRWLLALGTFRALRKVSSASPRCRHLGLRGGGGARHEGGGGQEGTAGDAMVHGSKYLEPGPEFSLRGGGTP